MTQNEIINVLITKTQKIIYGKINKKRCKKGQGITPYEAATILSLVLKTDLNYIFNRLIKF